MSVRRACESLVADAHVESVHVVDRDGTVLASAPANVAADLAAIAGLGKQIARGGRSRPCVRERLDAHVNGIGVRVGEREALVVVYRDDTDTAQLPRLMARTVVELRARRRGSGGSGGTPNDAHAFVSVRDLDHDA